jgi:elongation factor G
MSPSERNPPHVISAKVEPKTKDSEPALRDTLEQLARENSRLSYEIDAESGETILHSDSEEDLDTAIAELTARGINVNRGPPVVAYRETLARPTEVEFTHRKVVGGAGQFAHVKLRLEPNETGKGNAFSATVVGGTVPEKYIPAVEEGVRAIWEIGILIGFPMIDMKVTLFDGAFHETDSSAIAFETAARAAMKEGCTKAGVTLLEPIMELEVTTPSGFADGIIGDIKRCPGVVRSIKPLDNALIAINALVPLAQLFDYATRLRTSTSGAASYRMAFSHYEAVPRRGPRGPDDFPPAVGMRA